MALRHTPLIHTRRLFYHVFISMNNSRRAGSRCMNIIKISIARQPQKTFEKFMVIPKSRNTTPIWPIRTQKCHFSWTEKFVWCHHDISVRCFKHIRHLVRKPNGRILHQGSLVWLLKQPPDSIANFSKIRLCPIFAYIQWKNLEFLLSVCEIVPIFILETFFVPLFTKGPSRVRQNKLPIWRNL